MLPLIPMESVPSPNPALIHGLEDRPPAAAAALAAFQQVLAMAVGTVTPPLLLAGSLGFSAPDTAHLVSVALLASALGTWLQIRRRGPLGSGLLSVTGTSFSFVGPLQEAFKLGGFGLMTSMGLLAAPLQLLLAPFLPRLRRVFRPEVTGVVVLLIGLSLIPTAMFSVGARLSGHSQAVSVAVAALVVGVSVVCQVAGPKWLRLGAILAGIAAGCIACAALGAVKPPETAGLPWLAFPKPMRWGFEIHLRSLLPFLFIYLVSMLEAMGDMTATARLSGLPTEGPDFWKRLRGGVMADSLTSIASGLFGGLPNTTYAQNNSVIQVTGVASRRVGYWMAGFLAVAGISPAVAAWIVVLPGPVLGGLALMLFGMVAAAGLRLVAAAGLDTRNMILVGVSLGVGIGMASAPELTSSLPKLFRALFESPISGGGLTAMILGILLPGRPPETLAGPAPGVGE